MVKTLKGPLATLALTASRFTGLEGVCTPASAFIAPLAPLFAALGCAAWSSLVRCVGRLAVSCALGVFMAGLQLYPWLAKSRGLDILTMAGNEERVGALSRILRHIPRRRFSPCGKRCPPMCDNAPTGCTFSSILQTMALPFWRDVGLAGAKRSRRSTGQGPAAFLGNWARQPGEQVLSAKQAEILRERANSLGGKT